MELNDSIHKKIEGLCKKGDNYIEISRYDAAIEKYSEALNLVPLPKTDWEASTWIYAALGDAYFFKEDYNEALNNFFNAMNCPDGEANPFILLRIGECMYECKQQDKAKEFLMKAYIMEGEEIFEDEEDKYFELIKQLI